MVTSESSGELQRLRLQEIERGKQAAFSASYIAGPIKEMRDKTIQMMIAKYRSGETSHDRLVGWVAELSALDSLLNELEVDQRRGFTAQQKEYK